MFSERVPSNFIGAEDLSAVDGKILVFYLENTFFLHSMHMISIFTESVLNFLSCAELCIFTHFQTLSLLKENHLQKPFGLEDRAFSMGIMGTVWGYGGCYSKINQIDLPSFSGPRSWDPACILKCNMVEALEVRFSPNTAG